MAYQWSRTAMETVFMLPASVVDRHIRLAGAAQLKVLLWLSRSGISTFDAAACAAALRLPVADCTDALRYWVETGVLEETDAAAEPAVPVTAPVCPVKTSDGAAELTDSDTPKPVARPAAVKPSVQDVITRRQKDAEFGYLLEAVSGKLGRPITNADMTTLLYLYDTAGLPVEVILMVVSHAVSRDKPHLRYIEKVALSWADEGIDTITAAEAHLCRLDRREQAWAKLETVLGIHRTPTVGQMDKAEQWLCDWHMDEGLIRKAYEITLEKTGKCQFSYLARILEGWREDGIQTADDTDKPASPRSGKAPAVADSSLDAAAYEKMLEDFIPVYPGSKAEGAR